MEGPREADGVGVSPSPPQFPAPRRDLLQLEVVGALLELLVFGFHRFAQFLQNLGWREMETREKLSAPSSALPHWALPPGGERGRPR